MGPSIKPGRVSMEKCAQDLIFLREMPFGFLVGEGLFFLTAETRFFRQSESIYFGNPKKVFFLQLLLSPIRMFNLSFIK